MYYLFNAIDGELRTIRSEKHLIKLIQEIVTENGDSDIISTENDCFNYIQEFSNSLSLIKISDLVEFIRQYGIKVKKSETLDYVELMMDNHICIKFKDAQYYIPEDVNYNDGDELIYDFTLNLRI